MQLSLSLKISQLFRQTEKSQMASKALFKLRMQLGTFPVPWVLVIIYIKTLNTTYIHAYNWWKERDSRFDWTLLTESIILN